VRAHLDIAGQRFGRLVAIRVFGRTRIGGHTLWKCRCDCGKTCNVRLTNLNRGFSKSCGCLKRERARQSKGLRKHGMSGTAEYRTYLDAKAKCKNPNNRDYGRFGAVGVKFLFKSFEQFFAELGRRPKGKVLDRHNRFGNFEQGNVRWAPLNDVAKNRRKHKLLLRRHLKLQKVFARTTLLGKHHR
jgi:hypothetical protein